MSILVKRGQGHAVTLIIRLVEVVDVYRHSNLELINGVEK